MIQLLINKKTAILPHDFIFTMIYENPYFTKASAYSLEVELPMPANRHIFGAIDRIDTTKERILYSALLINGNRSLLNGTAVLLHVERTLVKIQLASGNSELNLLANASDYIDEISLGNIPVPTYSENTEEDKIYYCSPEREGVIAPVKVGDNIANNLNLKASGGFAFGGMGFVDPILYAQPYLWTVVERLVAHYGYDIQSNFLKESWMRYIYIVSCSFAWGRASDVREALPHWSVSDFLEAVERFAGVVCVVDDNDKSFKLVDINNYFSDESVYLDVVGDDYEVDTNEDTEELDITKGNTKYKLASGIDDGFNIIKKELREGVTNFNASTHRAAHAQWTEDTDEVKKKTLYNAENRSYINYVKEGANTFKEVDLYGQLVRDNEEDAPSNTLEIAPAKVELLDVGLWAYGQFADIYKEESLFSHVPVSSYDNSIGMVVTNIQEYIEGAADTTYTIDRDRKDVLEVAIYDGLTEIDRNNEAFKLPSPFMDHTQNLEAQTSRNEICSLSLKDVCEHSIGHRHKSMTAINSDVAYIFYFQADTVPPLNKTFIIRNQKYLARKIEVEINLDGLNKILKGEFYRID